MTIAAAIRCVRHQGELRGRRARSPITSGMIDSAVSVTVVITNVRSGRLARRESTTARIVPMRAPTKVSWREAEHRDRLAADLQ